MGVTPGDEPGIEVEFAAKLVTVILSIILYGRQAFSESCFQKLSLRDLDNPSVTHRHLLASGQRLSFKDHPLSVLKPQSQSLIYIREGNELRLQGLLTDLDQIVAAISQSAVGKIYICFTDSKRWARGSLLECYTLKFSYQQPEGFTIYVDWAGTNDKPAAEEATVDLFDSLKQLVLGCPQLPDVFYTRLFVSSVDNQTNLHGDWAGNGHGVRETLLHLKNKRGAGSGRVGQISYTPDPGEAAQQAPDANGPPIAKASRRSETPELPELGSPTLSTVSSDLDLAASPARPTSEPTAIDQKKSQKVDNSRTPLQDPVGVMLHPDMELDPHSRHAGVFSAEHLGPDGANPTPSHRLPGSTVIQSPLRKLSKKRRAPRDGFSPVDRFIGDRDRVVSKYPRLAMIEEVPEDLPPTQRLETPSQSRQIKSPTKGSLAFCFD